LRTPGNGPWLILLVLVAGCGDIEAPPPTPPEDAAAPVARTLDPVAGAVLEGELAGGETHTVELELAAGELADLVVEQRGIDVEARWTAPGGELLRTVDSPNGTGGFEPLPVVAGTAGAYRLEVRSLVPSAPPGRYAVRLQELRPATPEDRRRAAAEDALAAAAAMAAEGGRDHLEQALESYAAAADEMAALGLAERRADVLFAVGQTHRALGAPGPAIAAFREAVPEFRAGVEREKLAVTLNNLGLAYWARGDLQDAVANYREALELHRGLGERRSEAAALNNLGEAWASLGRVESAFSCYERALAIWEELGAQDQIGITLSSLGALYYHQGEQASALDLFERALPLLDSGGRRWHHAVTLGRIGGLKALDGDAGGLSDLEAALSEQRELGDRREEAGLISDLGLAYRRLGRPSEARDRFAQALDLFRELGDRLSEATALRNLGTVAIELGEPDAALERFRDAASLYRQAGNPEGEIQTHYGLAVGLHQRGDLAAAWDEAYAAVMGIEGLLGAAVGDDLRTAFLADSQDVYRFAIELAFERHRLDPGAGHDRAALFVSEWARARGLLDALAEAGLGRQADAALGGEEAELRNQLRAVEDQRRRLLADGAGAEERERLARERRHLVRGYHRLRSKRLLADPGYSALARPRVLPADEIQHQLLDPDTLLLEVALGEARSFLWVVGRDVLATFELPPRSEIEAAARRTHTLLASSSARPARGPTELALDELGGLLLGPAASLLDGQRLVIVPDGALFYLPFGALRLDGEPLIDRHEVVTVPSASILAALREERARRPPPLDRVAVFADPVFSAADPRVTGDGGGAPASELRSSLELDRFPRLSFSRNEAEAILAQAPDDGVLAAFGFDANLESVEDTDLSRYRILHFATHAVLDTETPELSSIVLSLVDRDGNARDGYLWGPDIGDLALSAELVVLSACETALGKQVRGEGVVGLTRSFLAAGAGRVLVSLWRVDDRATSELMDRFYRALFDGRSASAALRQAQLALRGEPAWSAPYYWAGFVLQGDWR
jgi:CHAT domain-containing protein/tetratricopeptide (TPR) repeat protein